MTGGGGLRFVFIVGLFQRTGATRLRILSSTGQHALAAQEKKHTQHRHQQNYGHNIAHDTVSFRPFRPRQDCVAGRTELNAHGLKTAVGIDDVASHGAAQV